MKRIMTYGSRYGTTRRYAEKLSEITGIPLMNEADVGDLSSFGHIIHLGGLYAGGVKGLRKVVKHMPKGASLLVITVGLADVNNEVNTAKIKRREVLGPRRFVGADAGRASKGGLIIPG